MSLSTASVSASNSATTATAIEDKPQTPPISAHGKEEPQQKELEGSVTGEKKKVVKRRKSAENGEKTVEATTGENKPKKYVTFNY